MLVVCDIDLTIADARERFKGVGSAPPAKQRKALQLWLDRLQPEDKLILDAPITPVLDMIHMFKRKRGYSLVYLTGRSEKYRKATMEWLARVKAPKAPLLMRKENDWRTPKNCKMEIMKSLAKYYEDKVTVIDDDGAGDCSKAYQKMGWLHLKVIL
jgi:hypothetical protein